MSEEPENLMLVYLRRIDQRTERLEEDMRDIKRRVTAVEEGIAVLNHGYAGVQLRMDRLEDRIGRIERRLELRDTRV